jgi:hypothetical protein
MSETIQTKRAEYMHGDLTFAEYYGILVERLGEAQLRRLLPGNRTPAEWRALLEQDKHLNNVPLRQWDDRAPFVRALASRAGDLKPITGSGGWSLGDSVCVLKTTARRYALSS